MYSAATGTPFGATVVTAMRNRPGSAPHSCGNGRAAEGAEAVGAMGRRQHARPYGGSGPAARASGDAGQVPWIAGWTMELRLAGEAQAQFTGIGLAEIDQSGALQPFDLFAVFRWDGG